MHQIKRILALTIAALMALSACAFAEEEDLAAQLEAANARIAELEARRPLRRHRTQGLRPYNR